MPNISKAFFLVFAFFGLYAFAQNPADMTAPVASRMEGSNTLYYSSLHEAVAAVPAAHEAASGVSIENPDEITLLADITIYASLEIKEGQHIRLVPGSGSALLDGTLSDSFQSNWTIMRGHDFIDFPVIWLSGDNASLSLGQSGMEHELFIDGAYLNTPSTQAHAPLVVVNGRNAKLIMYDGVTIQNNYNIGAGEGTSLYQNGSGVFIRTVDNDMDNLAEFIMKGGIIQGNTNNTQNPIACGGGVYIAGFGLFTMECGVITNNTAYISGGGFHTGSRGSFKKTGGIIYGSDAAEGYRNTVINGVGMPIVYGNAVCVALVNNPFLKFRDDTVGENDHLSYTGSPTENGIFGETEMWFANIPIDNNRINLFIIVIVLTVGVFILIVLLRVRHKRLAIVPVSASQINIDDLDIELSPKEKNVLDLLFTDLSFKQIADTLQLTHEGVKYHNKKIYSKLGVTNRTELLVKYKKR